MIIVVAIIVFCLYFHYQGKEQREEEEQRRATEELERQAKERERVELEDKSEKKYLDYFKVEIDKLGVKSFHSKWETFSFGMKCFDGYGVDMNKNLYLFEPPLKDERKISSLTKAANSSPTSIGGGMNWP